ncbi:MAG TPA: hypothetical protein VMT39_02610 [Candidatus Bathyarchaeia archaeon]|nr:hypothetical protein [Candidatus Bathyarchaeia archaeon]
MGMQDNLIARIAEVDQHGGVQSVDVSSLLRQLILFDRCLVNSHRLAEFPFLVRSLGFNGVMELLSSGAVEIICHPFTIAVDFHVGDKRKLPPYYYDCGSVHAASLEQYFHDCLRSFHNDLDIGHAKVKALKKTVVSRIVDVPRSSDDDVLAQVKAEFTGRSPAIRSAIRAQLRKTLPRNEIPEFDLQFEFVPNVGFHANTNLSHRLGVTDTEAHGLIQSAFAAVANLDQRLGQMKALHAVTGFAEDEAELFTDKCGFLLSEITPPILEADFQRVLQIAGMPELTTDSSSSMTSVARLLTIRQTPECEEFRRWLRSIRHATDAEIAERVTSIKAKLSAFLRSDSGKTVRIVAQLGVGAVPHYGLPAVIVAGVVDEFLIDELLPNPGVACFLHNLYPSLFDSA